MSLTTTGGMGSSLMPHNMTEAVHLAEMMAKGKFGMPEHLRANPGDCLMVIEQAMRWKMSPWAVGQCTSKIKDKLMYEGKLVAAAVETSGAIIGFLDYQFKGEGMNRTVTVIGTRIGEREPKTVDVVLKDAITENGIWKKQPDQQLCYHGARVWARRWTPAVMLGVYAPDEFDAEPARAPDTFTGPTIDARAEPAPNGPTGRDAINEAVPIAPRKQTITEWLDALETDLKAATTGDAVDAIIARDEVQKAQDAFKNGARDRLNAMVKEALDRTSLTGDAEFLAQGERMET